MLCPPIPLPALRRSARARLAALGRALLAPERWVLLSACDWYPDGGGYPANHAALLAAATDDDSRA